jgi:DNA-binding transcriptional LysR family regulator
MLNLRAVETLREVAARGSFSAAATALHFTQPAVSRQVALLERSVGMPLVVRSRQGVRLTPAGRLVVEHADAIRARLQRLEDELAEMSEGVRLHVTLGGFPTAFIGLVPAIIGRLRKQAPDATIALRRCGHDEAVALVRAAELDLALVFARPDVPADRGDIEVVALADEPMLALLPRRHPLAEQGELELAALADEPWIVGARDPVSSVIATACRLAGFEPRIAFETDDALATESLVGAGLGVSLSSPWLAAALRDDVVLRPLAPPVPTRRVDAVIADPPGPGARLLLDLARATSAAKLPD